MYPEVNRARRALRLQPLVAAPESSAERSARVKKQLRDKYGKWIEMGGGIKWTVSGTGTTYTGTVSGFAGDYVIVKGVKYRHASGKTGSIADGGKPIQVHKNHVEVSVQAKARLSPEGTEAEPAPAADQPTQVVEQTQSQLAQALKKIGIDDETISKVEAATSQEEHDAVWVDSDSAQEADDRYNSAIMADNPSPTEKKFANDYNFAMEEIEAKHSGVDTGGVSAGPDPDAPEGTAYSIDTKLDDWAFVNTLKVGEEVMPTNTQYYGSHYINPQTRQHLTGETWRVASSGSEFGQFYVDLEKPDGSVLRLKPQVGAKYKMLRKTDAVAAQIPDDVPEETPQPNEDPAADLPPQSESASWMDADTAADLLEAVGETIDVLDELGISARDFDYGDMYAGLASIHEQFEAGDGDPDPAVLYGLAGDLRNLLDEMQLPQGAKSTLNKTADMLEMSADGGPMLDEPAAEVPEAATPAPIAVEDAPQQVAPEEEVAPAAEKLTNIAQLDELPVGSVIKSDTYSGTREYKKNDEGNWTMLPEGKHPSWSNLPSSTFAKTLNDPTAKITVVDVPEAAAPEQADEPVAPALDTPIDVTTWQKTGSQKGSNPGGTYTDPGGNKYYVKQSKSDDHARNEVLAARLYELAGIDMAELDLADVGGGKLGTVAPMIPGAKTDLKQHLNDQAYVDKIREGFAVDAWVANWDVAGLVFDNVVTDAAGNPVRIDPGGALIYRAQGAPKGHLFGDQVGELDTLRSSSMNPQSSKIFGGITDEQLKASAQRVANISPEQIDAAVDSVGFDPQTAQMLKDRLKARRADLMQRTGVSSDDVAFDEPAAAPEPTNVVDVEPDTDISPDVANLPIKIVDNDTAQLLAEQPHIVNGYEAAMNGDTAESGEPPTDGDRAALVYDALVQYNGVRRVIQDEKGTVLAASRTVETDEHHTLESVGAMQAGTGAGTRLIEETEKRAHSLGLPVRLEASDLVADWWKSRGYAMNPSGDDGYYYLYPPQTDTAPDSSADADAPALGQFEVLDDPGQSGDGYYPGTKMWGKYGAAGVMLRHVDENGVERFLMVQRGPIVSSNKGKWQLPGGALNSNENDYQGTARELSEELSPPTGYLSGVTPAGEVKFEHESGWHYTNIAANVNEQFTPEVDGTETGDAGWFTKEEIANLPLHPALQDNLEKIFGKFSSDTSETEVEEIAPEDVADVEDVVVDESTGTPDYLSELAGQSIANAMDVIDNELHPSGFVLTEDYDVLMTAANSPGNVTPEQLDEAAASLAQQAATFAEDATASDAASAQALIDWTNSLRGELAPHLDGDSPHPWVDSPVDHPEAGPLTVGDLITDPSYAESIDVGSVVGVTTSGGTDKYLKVDENTWVTADGYDINNDNLESYIASSNNFVHFLFQGADDVEQHDDGQYYVGGELWTMDWEPSAADAPEDGTDPTDEPWSVANAGEPIGQVQLTYYGAPTKVYAGDKVVDLDEGNLVVLRPDGATFVTADGEDADPEQWEEWNEYSHDRTHIKPITEKLPSTPSDDPWYTGPATPPAPDSVEAIGQPTPQPPQDVAPEELADWEHELLYGYPKDLPKQPYGTVGELPGGGHYLTASDGNTIILGSEVHHPGKGYTGTVVEIEANGKYVQVQVNETGKKHGLTTSKLTVKQPDLPAAPAAPEPAPEAESWVPEKGEIIADPEQLQELPVGSVIDTEAFTVTKVGADEWVDKYGEFIPHSYILDHVNNGIVTVDSVGDGTVPESDVIDTPDSGPGDPIKKAADELPWVDSNMAFAVVNAVDTLNDDTVPDAVKADALKTLYGVIDGHKENLFNAGQMETFDEWDDFALLIEAETKKYDASWTPVQPEEDENPPLEDAAPEPQAAPDGVATPIDSVKDLEDAPVGSVLHYNNPAAPSKFTKNSDGLWTNENGVDYGSFIFGYGVSHGWASLEEPATAGQQPTAQEPQAQAVPDGVANPVTDISELENAPVGYVLHYNAPAGKLKFTKTAENTWTSETGGEYFTVNFANGVDNGWVSLEAPATPASVPTPVGSLMELADAPVGAVVYYKNDIKYTKVDVGLWESENGDYFNTSEFEDSVNLGLLLLEAPASTPDEAPVDGSGSTPVSSIEELYEAPAGSVLYFNSDGPDKWTKNAAGLWLSQTGTYYKTADFKSGVDLGWAFLETPASTQKVGDPITSIAQLDAFPEGTEVRLNNQVPGAIDAIYVKQANGNWQHKTAGFEVEPSGFNESIKLQTVTFDLHSLPGQQPAAEDEPQPAKAGDSLHIVQQLDELPTGATIKAESPFSQTTYVKQADGEWAALSEDGVPWPSTYHSVAFQGVFDDPDNNVTVLDVPDSAVDAQQSTPTLQPGDTIESPEQMHALPVGTVLDYSHGGTFVKKDPQNWTYISEGGHEVATHNPDDSSTKFLIGQGGMSVKHVPGSAAEVQQSTPLPALQPGDTLESSEQMHELPVGTVLSYAYGGTFVKQDSVNWKFIGPSGGEDDENQYSPDGYSMGLWLGSGDISIKHIPGVVPAVGSKITDISQLHGLPDGAELTFEGGATLTRTPAGKWKASSPTWTGEYEQDSEVVKDWVLSGLLTLTNDGSAGAATPAFKDGDPVVSTDDLANAPVGTKVTYTDPKGTPEVYTKIGSNKWEGEKWPDMPVNDINFQGAIESSKTALVWGGGSPQTQTSTPPTSDTGEKVVSVDQLDALPVGSKIQDSAGTVYTKMPTGQWNAPDSGNWPSSSFVYAINADNLTMVDAGDSSPELPKLPYGTVGVTPAGKSYVTASDGNNIFVGSKVKHPQKGYEGTVVAIEANGKYVQVVVPSTGKQHGLTTSKLQVLDAQAPAGPAAPSSPAAPAPTPFAPFVPSAPSTWTPPTEGGDPDHPLYGQPEPAKPIPADVGVLPWVPDEQAFWDEAEKGYSAAFNGKLLASSSTTKSRVDAVINNGDLTALKKLLDRAVISQATYNAIVDRFNTVKATQVDAEAKMNAALKAWAEQVTEWKKANGITGNQFPGAPKPSTVAFDGGPADWTKAHPSTPTADAVFDALRAGGPDLAARGASIATDGDEIEDLDVRVMKVVDTDGQQKLEMKFKLTAWAGDALVSKLTGSGFTPTNGIKLRNRDKDAATGLPRYLDSAKYQTAGTTYIYADPATGARIEISRKSISPTVMNQDATHNQVRIFMPLNTTSAEYQAALQKIGIAKATPASESDIRAYAENKLISVAGGHTNPTQNYSSATQRAQKLAAIKAEYGIGLEDLHFTTDAWGRMKFFLSDAKRDAIIQKTNLKAITHTVSKAHDVDTWIGLLTGPQAGLGSTHVRWSEGLSTTQTVNYDDGQSSTSDMNSGGADYVFTRVDHSPQTQVTVSGYAGSRVYIHPKAAARRLDIYGNEKDNGTGKHLSKSKVYDLMAGNPYEIMFKHQVPVSDFWYVTVGSAAMRIKIIDELKNRGVTEINGIPVEQFVLTSGMHVPSVDEAQWDSAGLPPAITV